MARRPRPYLADSVYTALRQALVDGQFDSGEPLTEQELSRRFKVSRTPVREALAKLERDHLVRVVPKKGAFVRTASHDDIRELYQIRETLEALTVRLAAPRIDREALAGFEARFRELDRRATPPRYTGRSAPWARNSTPSSSSRRAMPSSPPSSTTSAASSAPSGPCRSWLRAACRAWSVSTSPSLPRSGVATSAARSGS
jgi:DNA-binding transcriptional regulator YhcF (GntR family)